MELSTDTSHELAAILEEVRPFVNGIQRSRDWYASHARQPRILFRTMGVLVICLSLSIPLVAALKFTGKDLVLSLAAILIAIATSLNSFFKWEHSWQAFRKSDFSLDHLLATWDLHRLEALNEKDPVKAKEKILLATQQLIEEGNRITSSETQEFFDRIEWPKKEK